MARFIPDPDISLEDLVESIAGTLAQAYEQVENELLAAVRDRARRDAELAALVPDMPAGRGMTVGERRARNHALAMLEAYRGRAARELKELAQQRVDELRDLDYAQRVVTVAATQGEAAAAAMLGFAGPVNPALTLTGTATQAAAMVMLSLHSRLEELHKRITRYPQDAYQRIVAMHTPSTLLGVATSKQRQAAIVQRFLSEGITGFVDRSGRRWTIGTYSEMAGRTTVARAFNDATEWRLTQAGLNLVTIAGGRDACDRCAPWIGIPLSTDGTPTGTYRVKSMGGPGDVTVTVHGTVDQARDAGWGHPNCRDRIVAFLPGVSTPAPIEYDPRAEGERVQQRALEREIRAAKRREATALDPADQRKAAADVTAAQADMREFIRETGRVRVSAREQLWFADSRGGTPGGSTSTTRPRAIRTDHVSSQRLQAVPPQTRIPQFKPDGLHVDDHEWAIGERLANVGFRVEWRPLVHGHRVSNPDVTLDGDVDHPWELKSPKGSGASNLSNQMRNAKAQGAHRLVIDMARSPLDEAEALAEIRRRFAADPWWEQIMFITKSETVTLLKKT